MGMRIPKEVRFFTVACTLSWMALAEKGIKHLKWTHSDWTAAGAITIQRSSFLLKSQLLQQNLPKNIVRVNS
ncbi:hypothetical protein Y1Q_0022265 [Alligator mississippiensis]|uniref:Secreted protein n=1 Tax=Alligator mississippiensis TaxID=8496 RepID=A0A151NZV7_ALLMI|nr:hypothetical protein Y1Q_0022265 [Alligator mississippiensis]